MSCTVFMRVCPLGALPGIAQKMGMIKALAARGGLANELRVVPELDTIMSSLDQPSLDLSWGLCIPLPVGFSSRL